MAWARCNARQYVTALHESVFRLAAVRLEQHQLHQPDINNNQAAVPAKYEMRRATIRFDL